MAAARPEGQEGGIGRIATVREALDKAEPSITTGFADRPVIEAAIRDTIGASYFYLGDQTPAIGQLLRARTLRTASLGPDQPDTLATNRLLADVYRESGRHAEAVELLEELLKRSRSKLGTDSDETLAQWVVLQSHTDTAAGSRRRLICSQTSWSCAKASSVQKTPARSWP